MFCLNCSFDDTESLVVCRRCGSPFGLDADGYFKAGMDALATDDIDRSISLLQSCIRLNQDHVSGRFNLGLALCHLDRCDEAMEHFKRVRQLCPDYPGIYTAMGQAAFGSYLEYQQMAQSCGEMMIGFLKQAITLDPDDVDACFSLGNAYLAIGDADQAVAWLVRAHALHPDSHAVYFTLAKALKELGQLEDAVDMARESLQRCSPKDMFWEESRRLFLELQDTQLTQKSSAHGG